MSTVRFHLGRIGAGLPVAEADERLRDALSHGAAIVIAPPGTGKTTYIPALVANLTAAESSGKTLVTQPRRVAVRAAAQRIAHLDGSQVGCSVGYTIRGDRQVSRATVLEVLTPGVLLRRLLSDPGLDGVGAVVLDEVHERSVDTDLLLGLLGEVRALREDLTVVAMSATLNANAIVPVLGDAPIVEVSAALHPLTTVHAPFSGQRLTPHGVSRDYLEHVSRVTLEWQDRVGSDALVFLPGAREVDEVVRSIRQSARNNLEVLPLHGQLPATGQDQALQGPSTSARIVVSTGLAESSVTVPGVHLVVDSGLAREVRRDQARDMSGLVTVSASRASATQRAGRAARVGPGTCVRVFSETELAHMPAQSQPEILSADLIDTALLLAAWGTPKGSGLILPTPPPPASINQAERTLHSMGLVDAQGRATSLGHKIAPLPVGVREARALLRGSELLANFARAAEIVAAFSGDFREHSADAETLLRSLRSRNHTGAKRWMHEVKRLTRVAGEHVQLEEDSSPVSIEHATGVLLALARPEWVARRTSPHSRTYLFASGTRAAVPEGSPLLHHEWIAVRDVQRSSSRSADGTGAVIRLAAPLGSQEAREHAAPLLHTSREARIEDGRVQVREQRALGRIVLSATPVTARPDDTVDAFLSHIREQGLGVLNWDREAVAMRGRLALLNRELGVPWPEVSDEALLQSIEMWLMPDLAMLQPASGLHRIDVAAALQRLLPWPEATRFEALAPQRLTVPSGSNVAISYPLENDTPPTVSVKLQEVFGLAETPRLVDGRVPVLFHLLSPARRPLAVTDDLASFWDGPYQEVRKEMRGRYSKHPWPEDPWSATPTARTNRAAGKSSGGSRA